MVNRLLLLPGLLWFLGLAADSLADDSHDPAQKVLSAIDGDIRVIAIGFSAKEGQGRWWLPDGTPIDNGKFGIAGKVVSSRQFQGTVSRAFPGMIVVLDKSGLPTNASLRWEFEGRPTFSTDATWDGKAWDDWMLVSVDTLPSHRTIKLRMGISHGDWKNVKESGTRGEVSWSSTGPDRILTMSRVLIDPESRESTVVVTHNCHDEFVRLIGFDQTGTELTAVSHRNVRVQDIIQGEFSFPDVQANDLVSLEFQVRSVIWREFDFRGDAKPDAMAVEFKPNQIQDARKR